jgi:predicted DNA-binding transcriptional regulator AlpA
VEKKEHSQILVQGGIVLDVTTTPEKRALSHKAVLARVPVSRTTLWRMERAGQFPKRIQISPNRVAWLEADIDTWLEQRKQNCGSS